MLYLQRMSEKLTFGGYPIELKYKNGEIYIHCKNIVGTLSQIEAFINDTSNKRHYFGNCKIRRWRNHKIKIDCLEESNRNFKEVYNKIKKIKNEY